MIAVTSLLLIAATIGLLHCCLLPLPQILNDSRKDGNEDDPQNHERKVFLHNGEIAKGIASKDAHADPHDTADDVIAGKLGVGHTADSGHKRGKRSHDGDEARDDNRFATIFFVELMGAVEIFFLENPTVLLRKNFRSHEMADGVIDRIAEDGGDG